MSTIPLRELWYIYSNRHREYLEEHLSAGTECEGAKELVFEPELKDLIIEFELKDLMIELELKDLMIELEQKEYSFA
jgi:hypothetical protein